MIEREKIPERKPGTLDIVKIDDRWAQVVGVGIGVDYMGVKYLDDASQERVYLKDVSLEKEIGQPVNIHESENNFEFPEKELQNVYYDATQNGDYFKKLVNIFGFYRRNPKT